MGWTRTIYPFLIILLNIDYLFLKEGRLVKKNKKKFCMKEQFKREKKTFNKKKKGTDAL